MRGWSHEEVNEVFARGSGARRTDGRGGHGPARFAVGGDRVDRAKIGCPAETLRGWVRQHERDSGQREGPTTADQKRVKELEREVRELRKANEILKLASAFFAQAELDRRFKS